ncbi:MAG: hypothetical protein OEZ34_06945 [Spirochaetia bacterium]|nr:hypothetical protein [Spirochaetia bacterium]
MNINHSSGIVNITGIFIIFFMMTSLASCATPRYSVTVKTIQEYENKKRLLKEKSQYNSEAEEEIDKNYKIAKKKIGKIADNIRPTEESKIAVYLENPPPDVTEYMLYNAKTDIVLSRTFKSKDNSFEFLGTIQPGPRVTGGSFEDIPPSTLKGKFYIGQYNEKWRNYYCKINAPFGILWTFSSLIPTTWPCFTDRKPGHEIRKKYFIQAGKRAAVAINGNAIIVYPLHTMNDQTGQILDEWTGASIYVINYHGMGTGRGKIIKIPKKIDDKSNESNCVKTLGGGASCTTKLHGF